MSTQCSKLYKSLEENKMQLNSLPKITKKRLKRVGRGHGSGRGKTSGRGTKGQKARRKIALSFEGGALPLVKRLPFLRGRGRNKIFKNSTIHINVGKLNLLPAKSVVDLESLLKYGIVKDEAKKTGVKILGNGELKVALKVRLPVSAGGKKKIEKAHGTVET